MNNNAKVFMTTSQDGLSTTDDFLEFDAQVTKEDKTIFIEFGNHTQFTKLGISKDIVTINQIGESVYTIIIKREQNTSFVYNTQYGDIKITLTPIAMEYNITDKEIDINLEYTLNFDQILVKTQNTFSLKCILL